MKKRFAFVWKSWSDHPTTVTLHTRESAEQVLNGPNHAPVANEWVLYELVPASVEEITVATTVKRILC